MKKRPFSVTIVGWLYIAAGAVGVAYHLTEFRAQQRFDGEILWITLVRLIAIVAGVYVLRGSNWARWLAVAWIAWHVILSGFHAWSELLTHAVLLVVFAFVLFRPQATRYFRPRRTEQA